MKLHTIPPTEQEIQAALVARHGQALQSKLNNATVAICGLGGLGSNIAIALARAGVGTLHLFDFDTVDLSNINRQQYNISQIGMPKTNALKENLLQAMPYTNIITDTVRLTESNIPELLKDADIICEAFDNAEAKAVLANVVMEKFPEKYLVCGSGMAGLSYGNTIKTRKITEHFYLCGDETSSVEEETTLFAARVMICAAHQAHTVLRILAGESDA